MQRLGHRNTDNGPAARGQDAAERGNPLAVRAATATDVDGRPDLEHIPAVERAWCFDSCDVEPECLNDCWNRRRLASARFGARPGDDGEVAEHNDGILDEDTVWMLFSLRHHNKLEPVRDEHVDVAAPLDASEVDVDPIAAVDVSDLALGEP